MPSRALARRRPSRTYARPNPISTGTVAALFGGTALLAIGAYYAFRPATTTAGTGALPVAGPTVPAPAPAAPATFTPGQNAVITLLSAGTATLAQVQAANFTPAQIAALPASALTEYGQLLAGLTNGGVPGVPGIITVPLPGSTPGSIPGINGVRTIANP